MFKNFIRTVDRTEDLLILISCLFIFFVGLYSLYDSYLVYKEANDNSLLKYKPSYEGVEPDKEIKGNMVAWITLDDTKIDYPVMQGSTNTEYLNKDPYGEYSLSGSIFLDYRNSPDFSDDYNLIYGHHMEHHAMFGAIDYFHEESYFNKHRKGTLIVTSSKGIAKYQLTVFAFGEALATDEEIFAPTMQTKETIAKYIENNNKYMDKSLLKNLKENDKILALSTCKYPDTADRTILYCIMSAQ